MGCTLNSCQVQRSPPLAGNEHAHEAVNAGHVAALPSQHFPLQGEQAFLAV